jgi:uracil-DNA glycosylase
MPRSTGQPHRLARLAAETDVAFGVEAIPRPRPGKPASPVPTVADDAEPSPARSSGALVLESIALPESREARIAALDDLRRRHDGACPHCTTATAHTQTVFGEGDPEARVFFVGEAPGETEDRLGRPFVGRAGEKLDEMIRAMGLRREAVYIANVLKSRPPDNRTPLQHEVDGCGPYLAEQIRIIRPAVIVTLGGPAAKLLLRTEAGITRLRGVWASYSLEGLGEIPVMPTFHPAYLLRNYTPETRRQVWNDLQAVVRRLADEG